MSWPIWQEGLSEAPADEPWQLGLAGRIPARRDLRNSCYANQSGVRLTLRATAAAQSVDTQVLTTRLSAKQFDKFSTSAHWTRRFLTQKRNGHTALDAVKTRPLGG